MQETSHQAIHKTRRRGIARDTAPNHTHVLKSRCLRETKHPRRDNAGTHVAPSWSTQRVGVLQLQLAELQDGRQCSVNVLLMFSMIHSIIFSRKQNTSANSLLVYGLGESESASSLFSF